MDILFNRLGEINFDISKIFAMNQTWDDGSSFTMNHPRPTNALLFFSGCDAEIKDAVSEKKSEIKYGNICIIPQGSMYTLTFYNNIESDGASSMLFEFILKDENGVQVNIADGIKVMDGINFVFYRQLFSELTECFSRPQISFPRLKAVGFSLIASVAEVLYEKGILKQKFSCIYDGIKYLENDTAQEKSIAQIAKMCGVNLNYFERLFKEYAGITPASYRLLRKIDSAKIMLEASVLSIEQIAAELNFCDTAYFCRCFKNMTGMTAKEYRMRTTVL